jgi:hypothetical protein
LVKNVAGCWKITANMRSIVHIGNSLIITLIFGSKHMLILEFLFITLMPSQFSRHNGLSWSLYHKKNKCFFRKHFAPLHKPKNTPYGLLSWFN